MLNAEAEPRIYELERGVVKQHTDYDNIVIMTEETWQDYIAEIKNVRNTEKWKNEVLSLLSIITEKVLEISGKE